VDDAALKLENVKSEGHKKVYVKEKIR